MKMVRGSIFLLTALIGCAQSATNNNQQSAFIKTFHNQQDGTGFYKYNVETVNGQRLYEEGQLLNKGNPQESIAVLGTFSWIDPNGTTNIIKYTADVRDFRSDGRYLPLATDILSERLFPHLHFIPQIPLITQNSQQNLPSVTYTISSTDSKPSLVVSDIKQNVASEKIPPTSLPGTNKINK